MPDSRPSNGGISTSSEREMEINALRQSSRQMKQDNEELKRRLAALERLTEENAILRRAKEESDILRSLLNAAQDDVKNLVEDNKTLQERMMDLQNQVVDKSSSGRNSWTLKR